MAKYACTAERFATDVRDHAMTVLLDQGIHRHLRFAKPGTNIESFEIVTVPGWLFYTGDMGSFTFQRVRDMFSFFRGDGINPGYWSEKLEAIDSGGFQEYDPTAMRRNVIEHFRDWCRDEEIPHEVRREAWEELRDEILDRCEDADPRQDGRLDEFEFKPDRFEFKPDRFPFKPDRFYLSDGDARTARPLAFSDTWEWRCTKSTYRFIWCCRALVWAIAKYDAHVAAKAEVPA